MNELKSMSSANNVKRFPKAEKEEQFLYLNRWVNKKGFCAFVYNQFDEQKLASSYEEFIKLIESGIWFSSKPEKRDFSVPLKEVKGAKKHGTDSR